MIWGADAVVENVADLESQRHYFVQPWRETTGRDSKQSKEKRGTGEADIERRDLMYRSGRDAIIQQLKGRKGW